MPKCRYYLKNGDSLIEWKECLMMKHQQMNGKQNMVNGGEIEEEI